MASRGKVSDKVKVDAFHGGIQYALDKLGKSNFVLKEPQYEILKAACDDEKRCFSGFTDWFRQVPHIPKFGFHLRFPEK